ncbi:Proton-coupled folate transporter [Aphelenchoides besseyi]|nr:Proton-coupled folate transporter [Aphelenchoides besseyi]
MYDAETFNDHRSSQIERSGTIVEERNWRSDIKHNFGLLWIALKSINAEIVVFLIYCGWAFGNTLQAPGLYRRICETYFEEARDNCSKIGRPEVERAVEQHTAEWSLYNSIAYLTPAIFVDTILGAYGDKHGRKINILFGIVGIAFSEYGFLLTLSESVNAPYFITPIFGLIAGLTGYIAMVPVSCNAYLADTTDNTELLTIRASVLMAAQNLGSVIGGVSAAFSSIRVGIAVDIEIGIYLLAFIYVIIRIPQTPGHRSSSVISPRSSQLQVPRSNTIMSSNSTRSGAVLQFFHELISLLKSGFRVYTRRRVGHRRAFMLFTMVVLMMTYTTAVETAINPILNSYVFRRTKGGLDWTTYDLGLWNGVGYLIVLIGNLLFLPFFKRVLRFRETTIILIGILSSSMRVALIGFSTRTWHMYVANVAGICSGTVLPAIVSFIVQIVPYEEVGRAFSLFGIGGDLAFIISYLVYNNVYRLTVAWFPGFMFVFIAGIQMIGFVGMVWVHFQSISESIDKNVSITRDSNRRVRAISTVSRSELPTRRENKKRLSLFHFGNN